ncbi:hypothetical protein FXO38_05799 [Capsicum annuum]|uniref:Uncharacterized protein n=1 Tax=Capsicum annuum TaxID=4072 RepID=A0A2G2Y1F7_CAPAN|nr:hypothetical protein FXO38_05799 [Capsicum annuum]KAF3675873.1 hypothetical protein FXO37_05629 [Capsicum annuum]PHT63549.1 hypothetical protein T459_32599 [Capsicum annuum]
MMRRSIGGREDGEMKDKMTLEWMTEDNERWFVFYIMYEVINGLLRVLLMLSPSIIAHLVNQQIVRELIALELLAVLLEKPTDDK